MRRINSEHTIALISVTVRLVLSNFMNFLQVLAHHLWLGNDVGKAVNTVRLHHQLEPNKLYFEEHFPEASLSRDLLALNLCMLKGSCGLLNTDVVLY